MRAFKSSVCIILLLVFVITLCACEKEVQGTGNAVFVGKIIGAPSNTDEYTVASSYSSVCEKVVGYNSLDAAVYALLNGKVDYVITDEATAYKIAKSNGKIKVAQNCVPTLGLCAYFPKESEYYELFEEALEALKENGTTNKLRDSYINGEAFSLSEEGSGEKIVAATCVSDFPFCEKKDDELFGVDIYMAREIAAYLGMSLEIKEYEFEEMFDAVLFGEADFLMGAALPTTSRSEDFLVSSPYYSIYYVAMSL